MKVKNYLCENEKIKLKSVHTYGVMECSKKITEDMKIEAAKAIAYILNDDDLKKDYIIPDVFDKRVVESVAEAVKKVAVSSGICR